MTGTPARGVPVRLLLVEDSENDAMLLLRELRRGGYEPVYQRVCTPEEMERALEGAAARGEPYEVVVSDYYMPRFRAPDALALLRRLGHDVPFIVVSGKIGEDAAVGIMKSGANDYLTKENMARLCPAIERELKEAGVRRERERAEEALARSEIRFRRLVEQAADAMFVHDLEGRFVDVNRRACESLGYAREELLGMTVSDVEVGHDPASLEGLWDEISCGTPLTLEGTHRRKDGTAFPVEVRVGVFEDGGRPLVLSLVRDISGRKEAEKRARETELRYRTLVEQLPAVAYVQDPFGDKLVTYVSPQTESVLGYPADRELLDPDHWLNIMHPDDRERVLEEDRRTDETGEPFKAEYRQFASDGRMVWIRDEATLVRDEEGRPLYWQGIQYDVTEEKLVEEELRRSEERYRTFIEQSTEGIWRFELEEPMPTGLPEAGQLDHFYRHAYLAECNDAMARMYGFGSASDLVGARVDDLLPRSEPENVEFLRAAARSGYRLKDGETRETDREGNERVILNNLTGVVEDGRLVRIWGTQRDVTEQKEAEEQLARLASFPELDPNPVIETSPDGVPTYLNPAAQARFPGLRELGPRHPALADLEEANARIWSAGGRPFVREVRVGDGFYQQVISRTPEGNLLRIYATDVTEGRRAEDALRASEERFRSLVQNASDIVIVLAADGTILYESPAVERMLGFAPEERIGLDVLGLIHPEDRDRVSEVLREHRDVPGPFPPLEYRVKDRRGSWRRLEAVGENLLCDPAVGGIVVNSRDVTDRAEAEEDLRKTLKELADLKFALDESAIVAITDQKGSITYVNDKFCEISGYSRDELIGQDHRLINSGYHEKDYIRGLWRTIARGRVWRGELKNRAKDGSSYWVDTTIVPFLDERGKPYQYVAIRHDVTARKRAEEALRESRESLQAILDNTTAVIYVKDTGGRYSLVNRRFEELFGLAREEVLGRTDHEFLPKVAADEYRRNDLEVLRSGAPLEAEEMVARGDGARVFFSVKFPLKGPDGLPYATCGISTDITSRTRTEQELKASEKRFRATFEQASVGMALVGTGGEMFRVNRKLCEILGYDAGELTGMNVAEVTHPEDLPADLDLAGRALAGETDDYSLEKRYVRRDGEVVWANVAASLVRGAGGEPEYFIGVVEDVTERRRAEYALREAEERYRTLVEGLPAVTYVRHVGSDTLSYASPQLEAVLGYGPGEYLADPDHFARTIHPDDRGRVLAEDERTNGTGEPYSVECRRITKDGRVVWVHDEAHLVRDAGGSPLYWQGFITDITDRKRAEESLRQSEELYRNVVEQAAESIFLLDVDSMRVLEANTALGATLGYSPEELKGMSFYDLSAHDKEAIDRNAERALREGRVSLGGRQYRRNDGGLVDVEISISIVPHDGRPTMCVVAHDVTGRLRAERALEEIREAERNRIARELHDSILQDIVYALQEIQVLQVMGQSGGDPALQNTADALRRSVEGLRGAIFELRLKETLDNSFLDSLENLVDLNRRMARGAYEIEFVVGEGVPPALPDGRGRELVRIVQEALTNVRRHSGARHVRVELGVEGEALRAEVSDNGRGFDPEGSRSGVGRHSMRQRALELGGEIELQSRPGRGTRVLCRVPLVPLTEGHPPVGRGF